MFNLTLRTKSEIQMLEQRIRELEVGLSLMRRERDHERVRSERAINLVLMKSVKAGINLDDRNEAAAQEAVLDKMLDIFGEQASGDGEQERILDAIQSDRT